MRRIVSFAALLFLFLLAPHAIAQQAGSPPPDLTPFEGWQEWPLIAPSDLRLDTGALGNQRIVFDGMFGPPGDPSPVTMYMDVFEVWHGGRPAYWIQWTSSGNPAGAAESVGIDTLVVDRETFRILFRVAATGPSGYALTVHGAEQITQFRLDADAGSATTHRAEEPAGSFDFATFQFLFPFLGLEDGRRFRLVNIGQPPDLEPREVAVLVAGKVLLEAGREDDPYNVEAWDVQVMPSHGRALIHFYVLEEAPFFYGWEYRLADGRLVSMMQLYEWSPLTSRRPDRRLPG